MPDACGRGALFCEVAITCGPNRPRQRVEDAVTTGVANESLNRQRSAELAAARADVDVARVRIHAEVFQLV